MTPAKTVLTGYLNTGIGRNDRSTLFVNHIRAAVNESAKLSDEQQIALSRVITDCLTCERATLVEATTIATWLNSCG